MADNLSKLARGFSKAIVARGRKPSGYTATAKVTRVDDNTAWVILPGSEIETPVNMAVAAKKGDTVTVRIENHRAVLTGNTTAPPTDDSKVDRLTAAISEGYFDGKPGADAVDILKVVNEYCLADDWKLDDGETFDDIKHSGSDWSEEFPEYTEDGVYVWARSVTYFVNGEIEYGDPYFYYTAAYVVKVETQFCLANNRAIPEGQTFDDIQYTDWSTEIVEMAAGKYYWRRTATYFSDGSVVYSDPEFDPSLQVMYETEAAINAAVSAAESAQEAAETAEGEASDAQEAAEQAKDDAVDVVNDQKKHFWYDSSTGAHVSQAENSIGTGAAVNATSSALTFTKDGYILGSLSRNALNFYDGDGAAASDANLLASYSKNGTTFYTNKHRSTSLTNSAVTFWDPTDTTNDGTVNQRKMAIFAKSSAQFYSDGNIMANWASNALNFYDGSAAAANANNLLASYTRSGVVLYGKYGTNAANTRLASFTPSGVTFWDPSDGNTAQAIFGSSGISFNTSVPFTIGNNSSYVKWVKKNNVWTIDIATDHLSIGGVDAATIDDVEDVPALSQITQVAKSATWATVQGWVGLTNDTWSGITSFSGNVGDTVLIAISVTDRDGQTGYMRCVVKGYSGTTLTTDNIDFMFGPTGQQGDTGTTFTPSVDASGNISWSNDGGKTNPTTRNIKGPEGDEGTTFTPSVDANGNISWTNNGGKTNPTTRNIKGPIGPEGPSSTYIDFYGSSYSSANQGLFVHSDAKGTLPSAGNGVQITNSDLKIRKAGVALASFGSTIKLGTSSGQNLEIGSSSITFKNGNDVIGYINPPTSGSSAWGYALSVPDYEIEEIGGQSSSAYIVKPGSMEFTYNGLLSKARSYVGSHQSNAVLLVSPFNEANNIDEATSFYVDNGSQAAGFVLGFNNSDTPTVKLMGYLNGASGARIGSYMTVSGASSATITLSTSYKYPAMTQTLSSWGNAFELDTTNNGIKCLYRGVIMLESSFRLYSDFTANDIINYGIYNYTKNVELTYGRIRPTIASPNQDAITSICYAVVSANDVIKPRILNATASRGVVQNQYTRLTARYISYD